MSKLKTFIPFALKLLRCLFCSTKHQKFHKLRQIVPGRPLFTIPNAFPFVGLICKVHCINNISNFEAEQQIAELLKKAEQFIAKKKYQDAKRLLEQAFLVAERDQAFGSITHVCDLQALIAFKEGGIVDAENSLVYSIEKLLQLGFTEDHNSIVRFKLKLARLYQMMGIREMAELGFKDCIRVQESKLKKAEKGSISLPDFGLINEIYMSALYWYGRLLRDDSNFPQAKEMYNKCLVQINLTNPEVLSQTLSETFASQKMVLLFELAEIVANMKEYDEAIAHLFDAIDICLRYVPKNPELPLYVVQVGMMFAKKGLFEGGDYWCKAGLEMAEKGKNDPAKNAAQDCLKMLADLQGKKANKEK